MKAEEQLKQSMQEMHLSTEAKNRILANVLSAPAEPEKQKKPFYCSKVFTRLAGAAAAVILVMCAVLAVSIMSGGKKEKSDASAPYERGEDKSTEPQEYIPAFSVAFSVNGKETEAASTANPVYSVDNPTDMKNETPDDRDKKSNSFIGWSFNADSPGCYELSKSNSTCLYSVWNKGETKEISFSTLLSLAGVLQKEMEADYPEGRCYILSVSETSGVYTVKLRFTETSEETESVYFLSENEIPAEGKDCTAVVLKDPETGQFKVESIK
ncbi:MAG: hypothetical protein J5845_07085 [Lachnospiraceae bacterium]|nr:hypothetical protein [Lachnospiraceae bacterium]